MDAAAIVSPFWLSPRPLALASRSAGRRLVLEDAGIPVESVDGSVDERRLESQIVESGGGADDVALGLAAAKALAAKLPAERLVLGADQVASCAGRRFGKPPTLEAAKRQLALLSGTTHRLHSALALARGGDVIFRTVGHADLTMRPLSEEYIDRYVETMGEAALSSAGAYQIEGLGAQLFSRVVGDHWTIIGLPLLPLLDALRREGLLR